MTDPLQSLWPEDVEVEDVLTPLTILKFQADELKKRTNGRLRAEIETAVEDSDVTHLFDVIAPSLNNYRIRLLTVCHNCDRVYPAKVQSDAIKLTWRQSSAAPTQSEFSDLIGKILQSDFTRSLVQSLLARISEKSHKTASQS
ncbi:MAG: hypothetical protein IID45_03730 [Planctomycetes bacterium]|nr:hypothetical protein [Planctomycetota bacterium]